MAYYVKIDDPKAFRREVLESSRKTIGCLQSLRDVLYIRKRKREYLLLLQKQVKEIDLLLAQLEKSLPEKQLREEALEELRQAKLEKQRLDVESAKSKKGSSVGKSSAKKKSSKSVKKSAKKGSGNDDTQKSNDDASVVGKKSQESTELDKLNDALSNIEEKLASLK